MILGYPFIEKKLWMKNELVWLGFSVDISAKKMRNFRSKTSFYARKSTVAVKIEEPLSKPGPVGRRFPTMGLANAPMASTVFSWSLRFL